MANMWAAGAAARSATMAAGVRRRAAAAPPIVTGSRACAVCSNPLRCCRDTASAIAAPCLYRCNYRCGAIAHRRVRLRQDHVFRRRSFLVRGLNGTRHLAARSQAVDTFAHSSARPAALPMPTISGPGEMPLRNSESSWTRKIKKLISMTLRVIIQLSPVTT